MLLMKCVIRVCGFCGAPFLVERRVYMRFIIVGSGGCCSIPRPGCMCRVCVEARAKGHPYARFGPSLWCEDASVLVDTPEDITAALNMSGINEVKKVIYTHPDPDHTMGMRVFEQLRLNWLNVHRGIFCSDPIEVVASEGTMPVLRKAGCGYGSSLEYYEKMRLITLSEKTCLEYRGVSITLVPAGENVSVIVFEKDGSRLVYAPCDCRPFPICPLVMNADCLVIGNTFHGNPRIGAEEYEYYAEKFGLFTRREAEELGRKINASRVIFTHLEEDWGLTKDDYDRMDNGYSSFAYDSMEICV